MASVVHTSTNRVSFTIPAHCQRQRRPRIAARMPAQLRGALSVVPLVRLWGCGMVRRPLSAHSHCATNKCMSGLGHGGALHLIMQQLYVSIYSSFFCPNIVMCTAQDPSNDVPEKSVPTSERIAHRLHLPPAFKRRRIQRSAQCSALRAC